MTYSGQMELGAIFDRHWDRVWRAAYAVSGDRELASDAAQDAFIRAGAALHRFDRSRPVEPWLVRIAVNRAIDLVRARRREDGEDELPETVAFDPPLPDDDLGEALRRLGPERRAVIALHYWLDYTTPEIAEILGVPLGTVNSRLARALRDLRLELEARNV
ncbi:MAG TPA: sigma-70 family RNA polymerase sigma factor [Gaiellaceae bacterium]|nr:sigma-70 family RNA polymerase sigma factor [Gaiellaceae bacterium]